MQGPGGKNVLLQEFIAESRGRDIRAFVIGRRVVAAMHAASAAVRAGHAPPPTEWPRSAALAGIVDELTVAGAVLTGSADGPGHIREIAR